MIFNEIGKEDSILWTLMVLDVVFRYLSLFVLYINIKIGKIDFKC